MKKTPFHSYLQSEWVQSQLKRLSLEEKIAQLIHIAAYSNRDESHYQKVLSLVKTYKIGGLIFFQGHPLKQAELTNLYQEHSDIPLMISMDAEWGLGMRLDDTLSFPYQMALGALQDNRLIYEMGAEIARQCSRLGMQVNFAPVVDINNNPANPVIGFRSFGEEKEAVVQKAKAYMQGMQDQGVMASAKHFPGHGDTATDSHFDLPVIHHNKARLEEVELYPFRALIDEGIGSMMVAHLQIPALDDRENTPSTVSKPIVTGLLKEKMGFEGLAFTDALDMKGIANLYEPGEVDLKAFLAGNDVLLFSEDVPTAVEKIARAVRAGEVAEEELDLRCAKNLAAKQWLGLTSHQPVVLENLVEDLHPQSAIELNQQLADQSVTLLKKQSTGFPMAHLAEERWASIAFVCQTETSASGALQHHTIDKGFQENTESSLVFLQQLLEKQLPGKVSHYQVFSQDKKNLDIAQLLEQYDRVLVSIHGLKMKALDNFGLSPDFIEKLNRLAASGKATICWLGNPYALGLIEKSHQAREVLLTYQESSYTQQAAANWLLGKLQPQGKLPVTVNQHFVRGQG
ncbi:glycoside hydrolase family 3 N-terminal domain-containing protein [Rapidithrix thailandica]|uniref:beta-N-acetylhexosaminidase n=1 Tax=Rapidithrix thailandica TaxID=413964 RepID=A0AAW9S2M6_9BACT